jgi:phosphate transport system substrate-binding protein
VRIIVSGGGTDLGFESFFDKKADLVMATRKILDKELQLAALTGIKPTELEIGKLAIAIITHPENPVSVLTMEQLRKILTGEYTKWTDVGGPNDPIIVITSEQVTGTALFLRKTVMENGIFGSDALARTYFHDIIIEVSRKKPFAISYAGLIDAERGVANKAIKIISLRKDDLSPPVSPSAETLRDGSYPLILPIYFYWNREAPGTHVTAFVDFCKAASQAGR